MSFFYRRLSLFPLASIVCVMSVALAPLAVNAQPSGSAGVVVYDSSTAQVQGQIPFSQTYVLKVTSPVTMASGPSVTTSYRVVPTGLPAGVSSATAISYITFNPAALVFTSGGQQLSTQVTFAVPDGALPGTYTYTLYVDGFPIPDGGLTNSGAFINAGVTVAPGFDPPTVNISTPADGDSIPNNTGVFPMSIPMAFTATVAGTNATPITSVTAELDGTTVSLSSLSGIGTTNVSGSGQLVVGSAGQHTVVVRASNQGGTVPDSNTFTITVPASPPTVVINTPTAGSNYVYRLGGAAVTVPFTFTAKSQVGGIRTLIAKVDGVEQPFTPSGIGTLTATGSINLTYTTAGTHNLQVITTDDYGTDDDVGSFSVSVVAPDPVIAITTPSNGQIFDITSGTTTSVPFRFVTTANNGYVVDSVSAMLGATSVSITSTTGLGTATAASTGTLSNLAAGTYTLTAFGTSSGIQVSTSVQFTVRSAAVPPSVVINTPPVGSVYTRVSGGPAISIPLTFTGTSNAADAVITQLSASLGTTPLSVATTNLNTRVANGSATLTVTNAGTYTISVTAVDKYGPASTTRTFQVNVVQGRTIGGKTFFDVDGNGTRAASEFGLSDVALTLLNASGQAVGSTTSGCDGTYAFNNVGPGSYTVSATAPQGMMATTPTVRAVTVGSTDVAVADIGFGLNLPAINGMIAGGYTIGYWKNNIDKALANKTAGTQVPKATLDSYTAKIAIFGLPPYDNLTMKQASATMGSNSSVPKDLLSKQLVASEYNYQNAAYLNGNKTLTMCFVWWGEYVLANSTQFSSTYVIWVKDWFDAYNNTHGGALIGP